MISRHRLKCIISPRQFESLSFKFKTESLKTGLAVCVIQIQTESKMWKGLVKSFILKLNRCINTAVRRLIGIEFELQLKLDQTKGLDLCYKTIFFLMKITKFWAMQYPWLWKSVCKKYWLKPKLADFLINEFYEFATHFG